MSMRLVLLLLLKIMMMVAFWKPRMVVFEM